MALHAKGVLEGIPATDFSMTSYGDHCSGPRFPPIKNQQASPRLTESIQMALQWCRGREDAAWRGTSLVPTPSLPCTYRHLPEGSNGSTG